MTASPPFYLGTRPRHAEIWSDGDERVLRIILPPKTRPELAEQAIRKTVPAWLDRLAQRLDLFPTSEVEVLGPFFCPFLEDDAFGRDLYLARARFRSLRPRLVPEDTVIAQRELAQEVGAERPARQRALPEDFERQLTFVKEHADQVYRDLLDVERRKGAPNDDAANA